MANGRDRTMLSPRRAEATDARSRTPAETNLDPRWGQCDHDAETARALDDAAASLAGGGELPPQLQRPHPPMLLEEEEAHPPMRDLPRPPQTSEERARNEAIWQAEEDREMAREERAELAREDEQRSRDERDRRAAADHPLLDDTSIARDFSTDNDNRGRGPDGFDLRSRDGGYVYGEGGLLNSDGVTVGLGIGHERGATADVDGPSAHFGAGEWRDQDGQTYAGIRLHGGVGSMTGHSENEMDPTSGSLAVGTFDAGIYDDGSTFTMGLQAGLADASVTLGNTSDPDLDTDSSVSVQAGFGPGAAFRVHHGDADGDGVPESGLGVSAFDMGVDVRSEVLGQAWNWVTDH